MDGPTQPERSPPSASSSMSGQSALTHRKLDVAIKAKGGSPSPTRSQSRGAQKASMPSWSLSSKPALTRPASASSLSGAEGERLDVKTLIQRHTQRQDSCTPPQSPSAAAGLRDTPKGNIKAIVSTCPSPPTSSPGQISSPNTARNQKTVVIRAVAKSVLVNRQTHASLLNSSPAIVVPTPRRNSTWAEPPAPPVPGRRDVVIHLSRQSAAGSSEDRSGTSREASKRLALLEEQQTEVLATLAAMREQMNAQEQGGGDLARISERLATLEAAGSSEPAECGPVASKLASSADALRALVWGSRSPSPSRVAPEAAQQLQQECRETQAAVKGFEGRLKTVEERGAEMTTLAREMGRLRSRLEDVCTSVSQQEADLKGVRKVLDNSPDQWAAGLHSGVDEQSMQEREAMVAAREVRVLDMQRRLADILAHVEAQAAIQGAVSSRAPGKDLATSGVGAGTEPSNKGFGKLKDMWRKMCESLQKMICRKSAT